jgi:hypothetical protein
MVGRFVLVCALRRTAVPVAAWVMSCRREAPLGVTISADCLDGGKVCANPCAAAGSRASRGWAAPARSTSAGNCTRGGCMVGKFVPPRTLRRTVAPAAARTMPQDTRASPGILPQGAWMVGRFVLARVLQLAVAPVAVEPCQRRRAVHQRSQLSSERLHGGKVCAASRAVADSVPVAA